MLCFGAIVAEFSPLRALRGARDLMLSVCGSVDAGSDGHSQLVAIMAHHRPSKPKGQLGPPRRPTAHVSAPQRAPANCDVPDTRRGEAQRTKKKSMAGHKRHSSRGAVHWLRLAAGPALGRGENATSKKNRYRQTHFASLASSRTPPASKTKRGTRIFSLGG